MSSERDPTSCLLIERLSAYSLQHLTQPLRLFVMATERPSLIDRVFQPC
ncbi:hypothetical protein BOSEA31B_10651 [Hyphomicrobiales bacterium]|nr:hypothetical protein BOSEA31B_10651 [Hyphomicrobiales bacterium]CAH1700503.1 hypothetical protein BOSEA1005_20202 [Hyphomicrobiales bacterium]